MFKKLSLLSILAVVLVAGTANASHSWGGYHWARTANPFTIKLGDNVSSTWDAYLGTAAINWSTSTVFDASVVSGNISPRTCKGVNGQVEVCNSRYGNNGWLGIAQIWVNGSHITKGTVKLNDTYFNTTQYNTPAWKNFVMCQEVGHTFGLDHQDVIFDNPNLGTCMDYTNDPDGTLHNQLSNEQPNTHDYDELGIIYAHLDSVNTISALLTGGTNRGNKPVGITEDIDFDNPKEWGDTIRKDARGKSSVHERDLGRGQKVLTFVVWAQ